MIETIATFDDVRLPNGIYQQSFADVETINQSEGGKKLRIVTRLQVRTITATYKTSSYEIPTLKRICEKTAGYLTFCGEKIRVSPRLKSSDLVEGSQNVENTAGLWSTIITFEEE